MAARLGDARGDEALALKTLEGGLKRFPEAAALDRAKALLYRAELAVRLGDLELARASLAAVAALALAGDEQAMIADEVAHVTELTR